jgi:PAS domain S-box-containing protein
MNSGTHNNINIRHLLLSLLTGLVFGVFVWYVWSLDYAEAEQDRREIAVAQSRLITERFIERADNEIERLRNYKRRIETHNDNPDLLWEFETDLILDQSVSVPFIQWITPDAAIARSYGDDDFLALPQLNPNENEQRMTGLRQSQKDSLLVVSGVYTIDDGRHFFIIDIPVYRGGEYIGSLAAGLDFSLVFDTVMQQREIYSVQLKDENGTVFYSYGIQTQEGRDGDLSHQQQMDVYNGQGGFWYATIVADREELRAEIFANLKLNLILGLMLSVLFAAGVYFMLGFYSAKRSYGHTNRKLRAVIRSSPLAIYTVNKKGVVTDFWNSAAERMFGYRAKQVIGHYLPDITKESAMEFQEMIHTVLGGEELYSYESVRTRKDGSEFDVRVFATPAKESGGDMAEVLVMVENITVQKQTERELQNEKQVSDTILKGQPGLFYLIDEKRSLVRWNKNVNDFFGLTDKELSGMNFLELFIEEERLKVLEAIQNANNEGVLEVETVVRTGGELYDFYINGTLMTIGQRRFIVGNGVNITERNRTRNELQRSLDEKEVLLSEIHHRVKNNLAIIANLIDIQIINIEDDSMTEILRETQNRIFSIAGVHEMLYDVKNFSQISFKEYLRKLFRRIFDLYEDKHHLTSYDLRVKVEYLNINQAIPLGLLLTEFITNSFKHGFDRSHAGLITIEITGGPDLIHVVYKDNGKGFDTEIFENSSSMGMILSRSLLKQLSAEYSVSGENGFEISFSFTTRTRGAHSTLN